MENEIYFNPPNRHWNLKKCSFNTFNAVSDSQKDALSFLREFNDKSPVGLYMYGPTGRGKSHLLVAAARHLKDSSMQVSYCDKTSLWPNITQHVVGYKPDNSIVTADVVIIDDLDIPHNDQTSSKLFYRLILDLYDRGKPTLFSSNHSPDDLVKKLMIAKDKKAVATAMGGEVLTEFGSDDEMRDRTLDRLFEMCLFIDLKDAPPHRRNMQEEYVAKYRRKE